MEPSKLVKAEGLGITIISEQEFLKLALIENEVYARDNI